MSRKEAPSILLFGATGLVGSHLLPALRAHVPKSPVTVFLRSTTIDTYLTSTLGVTSIVHGNFADLDLVEEVAREHDIVINVASSWDVGLSAAIVRGMRKGTEGRNGNGNGKQKSLIHMSGTGNFVDKTWTDGTHRAETKVWNDDNVEDMKLIHPGMLNGRPDTVVLGAGKTGKINSYIVFPSGIFGRSHPQPGLKPALGVAQLLMHAKALELGFVPYVGEGSTIFNSLHVNAITPFMLKLVDLAIQERDDEKLAWDPEVSPYERCFLIGGNETSWRETSNGFAKAFAKMGVIRDAKAKSVKTRQEAGEGEIPMLMSSDMRFVSPRAERLGYRNNELGLLEFLDTAVATDIFPTSS